MDADMTFDCARGVWFNDSETVRTRVAEGDDLGLLRTILYYCHKKRQ